MDKLKLLIKHQKKIIEAIFVCLIGGWSIVSIVTGSFKQISNLEYCSGVSPMMFTLLLIACSAAFAIIYFMHDNTARIIMFVFIYAYLVLCAYNSYNIQWNDVSCNPIGGICYLGVLCFLSVIAFLYVKEDIFQIFKKMKINKKTANIIIIIIGVAIFAFVAVITVLRYVSYGNSTFDFGIFAQMYEYMIQKGTVETTVERNYLLSHFGVHFSPVFYLTLPIYFIFPSPVTIQLIQAAMIALPLIPIVLLCRKYKLSHWMSIGISLIYILYPATSGGTCYDIHENCFLIFSVLMVIWALEQKKNIPLIIFILMTFMVKEDAAIYILALGTYYIFSRRDKKRGIILTIVSLIYFAVAISIVNSYGLGVLENRMNNLYYNPDAGMGQIVWTILMNPAYVIGQIVANYSADSMEKISYLIIMLVPIAGVLINVGKKYSRYILLAPFVVMNVFTTYLYLHDITFQYNFGTIALFMYVIIMNLSDMKLNKQKTATCIAVMCAGIMLTGTITPKMIHYVERYQENKATYKQIDEALEMIPDEASVCASGYFVPHLSKNLKLFDQNHLEEDMYTEYLAVDKRYSHEEEKFDNILASGQYELIRDVEGIIRIYQKKN